MNDDVRAVLSALEHFLGYTARRLSPLPSDVEDLAQEGVVAILEAATSGPHPMVYYRQRAWGAICNHVTRHLRPWRLLVCLDDFGHDDAWHLSPHSIADPERVALEIVALEQRLAAAELTLRQLAALMGEDGNPSARAARKRARARIRRGQRPGLRDETG